MLILIAVVYFFYEERMDALEEQTLRSPPWKTPNYVYCN